MLPDKIGISHRLIACLLRELSQVLNELSINSARSDVHARLMGELNEREISLYLAVLRDGKAAGVFRLSR